MSAIVPPNGTQEGGTAAVERCRRRFRLRGRGRGAGSLLAHALLYRASRTVRAEEPHYVFLPVPTAPKSKYFKLLVLDGNRREHFA